MEDDQDPIVFSIRCSSVALKQKQTTHRLLISKLNLRDIFRARSINWSFGLPTTQKTNFS